MTSGFCRKMWPLPPRKGPLWVSVRLPAVLVELLCLKVYLDGSSMVMMFALQLAVDRLHHPRSVVDFPWPLGPVMRTSPWVFRANSFRKWGCPGAAEGMVSETCRAVKATELRCGYRLHRNRPTTCCREGDVELHLRLEDPPLLRRVDRHDLLIDLRGLSAGWCAGDLVVHPDRRVGACRRDEVCRSTRRQREHAGEVALRRGACSRGVLLQLEGGG